MQIFHVLSIYFSSKDNKFLNLLYNIIAQSDVNIIEMFGFLHALTDYAKINVIFKLPYIPIHNMYITSILYVNVDSYRKQNSRRTSY